MEIENTSVSLQWLPWRNVNVTLWALIFNSTITTPCHFQTSQRYSPWRPIGVSSFIFIETIKARTRSHQFWFNRSTLLSKPIYKLKLQRKVTLKRGLTVVNDFHESLFTLTRTSRSRDFPTAFTYTISITPYLVRKSTRLPLSRWGVPIAC